MKRSKYILSTDELSDSGLAGKRIVFSTRTTTSILIDNSDYDKLFSGDSEMIDKELLDVLKNKEFLVPEDQDEFEHVMSVNALKKEQPSFLSMTIQPTANCQLGCHYCGQKHTKDYANDTVIQKYVDRIMELLDHKDYIGMSITWYGGEPLTGFSAIKKTSKKLRDMCSERGIHYMSDIVTNGLSLKPKLFKELVEDCKVTKYQITLDGTAESHDQRRMTKSGEPTYDIIMKNIIDVTSMKEYSDNHCQISIRVNIDQTNHQYVDPLIEAIKGNNLQNKVSIYFATITDFGGNDAGKAALKKVDFAQKEVDWLLKCYEYDIAVNVMPHRVYSVCMVENKDSEVFDAFGNVYTCWEFPYSDKYSKGDSMIGNLFNPKDTFNDNATLRDWTDTLRSGKTWCKTCDHLPVCGGGCPKSWHEGTPACPPFKSNYKDRLLLDYFIKKKNKLKGSNEAVQEHNFEQNFWTSFSV